MSQIFSQPFQIFGDTLGVVIRFFSDFWWIILPPIFFFILFDLWMNYIQTRFASKIQWVLLEVQIPKEILKTPKAMEQIFTGLYAISHSPNLIEKYRDGEVQRWLSFEIFANEEGVGFYIRTPVEYRRLVESQIYSQYPQAEIFEVEDYALRFKDLPTADHNLWGTEMVLAKDAKETAYPIRTYQYFEEKEEEKRLDPLASLTEVLSTLEPGEEVWIQILIRPTSDKWVKAGQELVDKLIGKKKPAVFGIADQVFEFSINLLKAPFEHPTWSVEQEKKEAPESLMQHLSPGKKTLVEAIEKKLSLLGFETGIRWLYHAPKDIYTKNLRARLAETFSFFRQFSVQDANSLKPNKTATTSVDYFFKRRREYVKKKALFVYYQIRLFPLISGPRTVLSVEELATVYHYPLVVVEAPKLRRLPFKKGAPPPTLPIEE